MSVQRGNPQLPIRLSPERRKLWEEAARIDRRSITDFIKKATDDLARVVIAFSKFTLFISCDAKFGGDETHDFNTKNEAMEYLKRRFPNYDSKDFELDEDTGPYDVWIVGPMNYKSRQRPVVWENWE